MNQRCEGFLTVYYITLFDIFSNYDVTLILKTAFLSSDFYLLSLCQQSYPSEYKSIKKPRVTIFSGQNARMTVLRTLLSGIKNSERINDAIVKED